MTLPKLLAFGVFPASLSALFVLPFVGVDVRGADRRGAAERISSTPLYGRVW